ncbi:MAG: methionine--tRNA ligase [Proteobacteria bacterium]|nr:methionine--tRNA ligase [Pseudomonadota bacterium]MBU1740231.1 methionine--tRNA ligase [Pseudomonadota bacterium]
MSRSYYVTTPIYYVNAEPHLGHAYTTIICDVLRRFHLLAGLDSYMQTGTDEHGDKVVQAAEAKGIPPKEYADRISLKFREAWPKLAIEPDYFIRTTDPGHVHVVQGILQKVYDQGDIYFGQYGGLYCFGCERFYTEKELIDGKCPDHLTEPTYIEEENYFFRMSRYQDWLIDYIKDHPDYIRPERYKNEVLSFLREPLEDLCISRPKTRLTWGIELPFDPKFVTYVWFDALINYVSGLGYPDGEKYQRYWPSVQHVIAKDILKPHGIFWPTMLKSAGIEPYRHLNVHGYWTVDGQKMSKSLGNVITPDLMADKFGIDAVRYYVCREMVFGLDGDFSQANFDERFNADLANDLGNLFSRSLAMLDKYFGGVVPEAETDQDLTDKGLAVMDEFGRLLPELAFHQALLAVWGLISAANHYIVDNEPWVLAKDSARKDRLAVVMNTLVQTLYRVAVLVWPVMPGAAAKMLDQLGAEGDDAARWFERARDEEPLAAGTKTGRGEALFPRIEKQAKAKKAKAPQKKAKKGKPEAAPAENIITFDDFRRLDLAVGLVTAAELVENTDRLMKLSVDLGEPEGQRTIVAGIARHYAADEMIGRRIVVVANLQPAKLKGIESRGMLLAAVDGDRMSLITPDSDVGPGTKIS